ncbi:hypothetical protein HDU67_006265 [Dinochytrium kinnereticum]|nr:hypothetical protein HDU67_006265 [Dinochytrium kinnereticum]
MNFNFFSFGETPTPRSPFGLPTPSPSPPRFGYSTPEAVPYGVVPTQLNFGSLPPTPPHFIQLAAQINLNDSQADCDMMDLCSDSSVKKVINERIKKGVPFRTILAERRAKRRIPVNRDGPRKVPESLPAPVGVRQKLTVKDARMKRSMEFFKRTKRDHDRVVAKSRGLPFDELRQNEPSNLGVYLNITQKFIPDLNMDLDQSVPSLPYGPVYLKDTSRSVVIKGIYDEEAIESSPAIRQDLDNAEDLVAKQFAAKNVIADLKGVREDGFSLEYAKDANTGKILGAAEFVHMRRYIWLDHLAVDLEARGLGVGVALLNRLKYVAASRGKQLFCFALHDVASWYAHQGFVSAENEFPMMPWHIGRFMVYTPPGVHVPVPAAKNLGLRTSGG